VLSANAKTASARVFSPSDATIVTEDKSIVDTDVDRDSTPCATVVRPSLKNCEIESKSIRFSSSSPFTVFSV
jgi:hypothetical protein